MPLTRATTLILFSMVLVFLSGCSSMMARSSSYSDILSPGTPKSEVIAILGQPKSTTILENDEYLIGDDKTPCTDDSFIVKGKVPEENLATNYMNANAITLGLAELLLFPIELMRSSYESLTEKEIFVAFCKRRGVDVLVGLPSQRKSSE